MMKLTLSSMLFVLPVLAFGATQSDTVPTSQLTASFQVSPAAVGDTQALALVSFNQVTVANGQINTVALDQSTDDVVVFSVGQNKLTFNPANPSANVIPFVPGATYTATFTRFNGESYTSTVVMPDLASFVSPTPNEVFQKTDAVNLAWSAVSYDQGIFLMSANCPNFDLSGLTYNADFTSAVIPAGAAAPCTNAVQMQFTQVFANGGTGFGSFVAASMGGVQFSYGTSASTPAHKTLSLRGVWIDSLIAQANKTQNHTLRMDF